MPNEQTEVISQVLETTAIFANNWQLNLVEGGVRFSFGESMGEEKTWFCAVFIPISSAQQLAVGLAQVLGQVEKMMLKAQGMKEN